MNVEAVEHNEQGSLFSGGNPPEAVPAPSHVRAMSAPPPPRLRTILGGLRRAILRLRARRPTRKSIWIEAVERRPDTFGGCAVITGTRIPVFFVEDVYRDEGLDGVMAAYPRLARVDISPPLRCAYLCPVAVEHDRRRYLGQVEAAARSFR
jgi:uncharacterized protein (DUF433 family)